MLNSQKFSKDKIVILLSRPNPKIKDSSLPKTTKADVKAAIISAFLISPAVVKKSSTALKLAWKRIKSTILVHVLMPNKCNLTRKSI